MQKKSNNSLDKIKKSTESIVLEDLILTNTDAKVTNKKDRIYRKMLK